MARESVGAARDVRLLVSLGVVYVVWGSTYLAIRVMVRSIPPLFGAGARFILAGFILGLWILVRRGVAAFGVSREQMANAVAIGLLILFGGIGLVTVAEQFVPSALTALLIASIPLWVVLLRLGHGEQVARRTIISVVLGFAGLALLLLPEERAEAADWGPTLLVVVAAGSTAIGSFYSNRWDVPSNTLVATVIEMLAAGIALIVAAAVTGELGDASVIDVSSSSLIAFAYLVTFGSLLAYNAFVWLLDNAPVSLVSTYAYVNPVIALILGVLLLNEDVSALMSLGAVAIVVSVVAVVRTEGST